MEVEKKMQQLAHFEIGWWKAHHRKDKKAFIENMTQLYHLQFNIDIETAKAAVLLRIKAADWHDLAEKYEDYKNQILSDLFWNNAEECLCKHFKILEEA